MNPATLLARLSSAPLSIMGNAIDGFRQSLQAVPSMADSSHAERLQAMSGEELQAYRLGRVYERVGPVAVISISGIIVKGVPAWALDYFWLCDLDDISAAVKLALADKQVKSVALIADSPGGYVLGVPECADQVFELAAAKHVVTYCGTINGSACYYIVSQAREVAITRSSINGSIGTYTVLAEYTKMYEEAGISIAFIREGKYKGMGHPLKELTTEERALIEGEIKELNDGFIAAVLRARPDVPRETMEGQTFTGQKAIDAGLADGIVQDLDEVVTALLTKK